MLRKTWSVLHCSTGVVHLFTQAASSLPALLFLTLLQEESRVWGMLSTCLFLKITTALDGIFPLLTVSGEHSGTESSTAWMLTRVRTAQLPADELLDLLGGDGDMSVAPRGLVKWVLDSLPPKKQLTPY